VDRLKQQAAMFAQAGVVMLCVFRSTPHYVAKYNSEVSEAGKDSLTLSDEKGLVFKAFTVKKSPSVMFQATAEIIKNYKKYKFEYMSISNETHGKGVTKSMQLPADFMIDENGVIVDLFRAKHVTEHMAFERVEEFIPKEKRCRCNGKDCIVPRCRKNHEESRRQWEEIYTGG